jgi:hypothetical protein
VAPEARTGGGDAAGEVVETGAGVTRIQAGDSVMGRCADGFAEYALLDAREVMTVPEQLSWEKAACIPIVFVVVHDAFFVSGQLRAGQTVMVTAVPSGVGVATLLLAKYLGARVMGTSRSAEKLERLKAHGLDVGIVTGAEGFGEAVAVAPLLILAPGQCRACSKIANASARGSAHRHLFRKPALRMHLTGHGGRFRGRSDEKSSSTALEAVVRRYPMGGDPSAAAGGSLRLQSAVSRSRPPGKRRCHDLSLT